MITDYIDMEVEKIMGLMGLRISGPVVVPQAVFLSRIIL